MKKTNLLLIGLFALLFQACNAQTVQNDFELFKNKFPEASGVVNMKHNNYSASKLTKEQALNILHIPENSLEYDDVAYDMDTDEETIYKKKTLPNARFCITKDSIMIFVYSVSYNYDYEDNYRYECFLLTTNKRGKLIDRQQIAKEYDQEDQSSHYNTVILNDSTYRVFNYNINEKYAVQKNGSYEVIDENEPQTKVTIVEYRIKNDGHITKSGYKDVRYAPKWVLYYERYSKTNMVSDDPMNEY